MQVLVTTRIVTRLLFLAVSEQLHDLLVRLGDAGGAHGAELDASLLRAAEDGVVAITDDHGGADVPRRLGAGGLLWIRIGRRGGHAHAITFVLRVGKVHQTSLVAHRVPHRLFDDFAHRFQLARIGFRDGHGFGDVRLERIRRDSDISEVANRLSGDASPLVGLVRS